VQHHQSIAIQDGINLEELRARLRKMNDTVPLENLEISEGMELIFPS
jgi:hypothetical protein